MRALSGSESFDMSEFEGRFFNAGLAGLLDFDLLSFRVDIQKTMSE